MQFPAQIQATIELLEESISSGYPADRLMANYFRSRRYIGSKDKAAISGYFYQALRSRLSLEYLLQSQQLLQAPNLLVAALLRLEGQDLAGVFTGQDYQPAKLAAQDMERLERINGSLLDSAPEHIKLNVPEWLEPSLRAALGKDFSAEMLAANQRAQTDIRVNCLQTDRDSLQHQLQEIGFNAIATPFSDWGLRFETRVPLFNTDLFRRGLFEVQDEGSQLLALLTQAKAGQKVVDFCAGAGGKTLAMAAMMENKGVIYACDVHSKRLLEAQKRAKRAGAHNIRTHHLSSEHDKWVKQHAQMADVVLVDAPCSGSGTWRRSPDSRWNLTPERLTDLQSIQASILTSAARLVKPGGRLLYATCSLLVEENESQVSMFLSAHEQFKEFIITLPSTLSSMQTEPKSALRLLTHRYQTDGFFVAQMTRQG
jgi:16S rRNA (cytosine967-C5)-methyltransferase